MFHSKPKSSEIITGEINHKTHTVISLTAEATYIIVSGRKGWKGTSGLKILEYT